MKYNKFVISFLLVLGLAAPALADWELNMGPHLMERGDWRIITAFEKGFDESETSIAPGFVSATMIRIESEKTLPDGTIEKVKVFDFLSFGGVTPINVAGKSSSGNIRSKVLIEGVNWLDYVSAGLTIEPEEIHLKAKEFLGFALGVSIPF